jgi:very-short-patch-repair endonuclease
MNYKRTSLEEKMKTILDSLCMEFSEQISTRSGFVVDFAIYVDRSKNQKIAIETDGSPWHTSAKSRQRDGLRDHILRKEGWKILRFDEKFTSQDVKQKIDTVIQALTNPA